MTVGYAKGTTVKPEKSRAEIEALLERYGADQFGHAWSSDGRALIQFRAHERLIRFELTLPPETDPRFAPRRRRYGQPPAAARRERYEAEVRRLWRSLALVVKAKLEAVSSGIVSFETEFLAYVVMPDGRTVGDHVRPAIASAYATGQVRALLPEVVS